MDRNDRPQIEGIHHLKLAVADLDCAAGFYARVSAPSAFRKRTITARQMDSSTPIS